MSTRLFRTSLPSAKKYMIFYKNLSPRYYQLSLSDFYVYRGENFELQLNEENYKVVLSFFFPVFNEMYNS